MCGIAGLVRWAGIRPDEADVGARMAATLRHRGPDDTGLHEDAWASFGHTRLSIIDIEGGHQPLCNEDGSVWIVFNGEIYNHREVRAELMARGRRFRTDSDTEVIVHLYEDHGPAFVHRLNGMFAIALWDARAHLLLLVRDRLGVKPLYWHDDGRRIVFGSELKALLAAGDLPATIDPCAIVDYLTFGHIPAPRTIYRDVRKLEPGYLALCNESGVRLQQYWDIPPALGGGETCDVRRETLDIRGCGSDVSRLTSHFSPPHGRWIEPFAALFEDAVRLRMIADVPLGAFLSGGLDSAAVVAGMTRVGSRLPISTHTVGFMESGFDERGPARRTAHLLESNHHEVLVNVDAADAAHRLAYYFDEPFADSSAVPTYYLSRSAREHVTVALAGDGADELLGGYRRYTFDLAEDRWRSRLPYFVKQAVNVSGYLYPQADWMPRPLRAKVTLQNIACDPILAHLRTTSLQCGVLPRLLLRPEMLSAVSHYDPFERPSALAQSYATDHLLGRLLYLDTKTLLPDDMLTKVDRMSMAVGLEVREPLLDYRLVEFVSRLPMPLRLRKEGLRGVLRHWSFRELADRPKKGFEIPVDRWFRGPLRPLARELLASPRSQIAEWVEPRAIERILTRHERGWRHQGAVLWALLGFELWARQHTGREACDGRVRSADASLVRVAGHKVQLTSHVSSGAA